MNENTMNATLAIDLTSIILSMMIFNTHQMQVSMITEDKHPEMMCYCARQIQCQLNCKKARECREMILGGQNVEGTNVTYEL